jgi:outer membrane protein OmpA-like peptidoglycan-associated protein
MKYTKLIEVFFLLMITLTLLSACQLIPQKQETPEISDKQALKQILQNLSMLSDNTGKLHNSNQALQSTQDNLIETESERDNDANRQISYLRQKKVDAEIALHDAEQALKEAETVRDAQDMQYMAYLAQQLSHAANRIAERKLSRMEQETILDKQVEFLINLRELEDDTLQTEIEVKSEELEEARQQNRQLQDHLVEMQSRHTEKGLVLSFGDIFFNLDKAELSPETLHNLDKVAEFLRYNPERKALVECHTDSSGAESYNLKLSQQRADFVRNALIERAVSPQQIIAKGYGESLPIASNDTPIGRQQNRRVEITISNK